MNQNKRIIWLGMGLFILTLLVVGCQTEREAFDGLTALMTSTVAEDGPGVVLYVQGDNSGDQVFARGLANIEEETAVRTVDHFRIAGISKAFISTMVTQAVEEELISLDDKLSDLIPAEIAAKIPHSDEITVHQLLTMQSGIADYRSNPEFRTAVIQKSSLGWQMEGLLTFAYDLPPDFAPGEATAYSNTNYLLLQIILEEVLESSLHGELKERILDPLKMEDTFFEPTTGESGAHIPGYADFDGDGVNENTWAYDDGRGFGDVGIVSNAIDLSSLARPLYQRAFTLETIQADTRTTTELENGDGYGMGIMRRESEWGAMWGYASVGSGFASQMWYLPDHDITVVVLVNHELPELATQLVQNAVEIAVEVETK